MLLPISGGVVADPITAAARGGVSLLDEGMKLALIGACAAISTYAAAWHQRALTRALAAQLARDRDERELSAQLQEADKLAALGILAASIAHEVNNPLSAIARARGDQSRDQRRAGAEGQTRERIVRVATWEDTDAVRLTVEDTAPGFAPGAAERLIQRFFTTKTAGKGTGLGLWMVAPVVEMHGGTVSAVDTGAGARFSLTFPRLAAAAAA